MEVFVRVTESKYEWRLSLNITEWLLGETDSRSRNSPPLMDTEV